MRATSDLANQEPKKGARIVVAMSGGVDSSVAAAWLKSRGYEVIGISLQLHDMAAQTENKFGTCCSLTDISDARRVAEQMDIPFYVANMEEKFASAVVDDFIQEYLSGRTPNPCVRCNEKVKFRHLMDWALDLGADYLATGHYATIRFDPESKLHELCRAKDPAKDQSYFLFTMRQEDLARTLFPIGGMEKTETRELARRLGLAVADKPDSQEICFVQARNYSEFIESRVAPELLHDGEIVDPDGRVLGKHTGLHHFTIGQRKGIGVQSKEPLYVTHLDVKSKRVTVGPEEALFRSDCTAAQVHWVSPPRLQDRQALTAKIRYRAKECPVEVFPLLDKRLEVKFAEPQRAISPGQAIVFYRNDQVVGGGWIEETFAQAAPQTAAATEKS